MKIQKLSLIAALALGSLLVCTSTASAQDAKEGKKGGRRQTIEQQMEKFTTELKLTDAQKTKVQAVLEDTQKKRQELRSSGAAADEMREKNRTLMQDQDKKLKEILKPEQFEKYQELQKQMRPRRGPAGAAPAEKSADKK